MEGAGPRNNARDPMDNVADSYVYCSAKTTVRAPAISQAPRLLRVSATRLQGAETHLHLMHQGEVMIV